MVVSWGDGVRVGWRTELDLRSRKPFDDPHRATALGASPTITGTGGGDLGLGLWCRTEQLRTTLPIRRVVGPADIAALAVHLMSNTAVTGATFDIDGGQQLVEGRY